MMKQWKGVFRWIYCMLNTKIFSSSNWTEVVNRCHTFRCWGVLVLQWAMRTYSVWVSMSRRLMQEQILVKLFRVIELTLMRTNVLLNALLGRYSCFCPLNFASKKKKRKKKAMPFEQQGAVKIHSERTSKSSLQSLSQNLMDCEHLMH